MIIFGAKYWRKRLWVFLLGAVLLSALTATLLVPGMLKKHTAPAAPGDLLMEQEINNRITLPALQGDPRAVLVMADICFRLENDPAAALQYLRYGAVQPTADAELLKRCIAAEYAVSGGRSSLYRSLLRRMAALKKISVEGGK